MTPLAVVLAAGILAVVMTARVLGKALARISDVLEATLGQIAAGPEVPFSQRLSDLEDLVERLPQRYEEFKNEARRAEGRARSVVSDALRQLDELGVEHAGISEQARELHLEDGGERGSEAVPAVRPQLESTPTAAEDWRSKALRKKFG